jgi:hypothetical protein
MDDLCLHYYYLFLSLTSVVVQRHDYQFVDDTFDENTNIDVDTLD